MKTRFTFTDRNDLHLQYHCRNRGIGPSQRIPWGWLCNEYGLAVDPSRIQVIARRDIEEDQWTILILLSVTSLPHTLLRRWPSPTLCNEKKCIRFVSKSNPNNEDWTEPSFSVWERLSLRPVMKKTPPMNLIEQHCYPAESIMMVQRSFLQPIRWEASIDLEIYISTGTTERHDFDIVDKVEMVSARRCAACSTSPFWERIAPE